MERVARLVVLHDRSAVGSGEPHCVADDPVQDLVEVEARADGLAHLPERLQLRDLACQLGPPGLECAHQVDLSQHDRTLDGELLEELAFTDVEGRDVGPPHRQHADDLVLQDHRRGEQGAETGKTLEVVASVVRVLEHVGNLMGTHVLGCAPDSGRMVPGNRVVQQVLAILLRGLAGDPREPEHIAVEEEQLGGLRSAQTRGVLDNGVQHVPGVGGRAAERREDLAARRGLMAGVSQLLVLPERGSCCACSAGRVFARIGHSYPPSATSIKVCAFSVGGSAERRIYLVAI